MEERDADGFDCPICAEPLDDTDLALLPCPCDYQICLWCLQRIRERENNRCPQCRREYDEVRYRRIRLDKLPRQPKKPPATLKERTDCSHRSACCEGHTDDSGAPVSSARSTLGKQPTICRLYNCPSQWMNAQILSQFRYLGKYGRLLSISIVPGKSSDTAFVTYASEDSALTAIQDVNKMTSRTSDPALKQIRFQMGAARHCIQPLRGLRCANEPCQFIHCNPSKLPRCFWKAGRKWPWTASVCPETVIYSTVADATKESLFMKTLADLAVMLPHLGIPSSAISAESRDLSAALNLTCGNPVTTVVKEDPAASDSQDDKPKRTWQKLSGAPAEEEDPLFPALTTRPPAKTQQQTNKKPAVPEETAPQPPSCTLALIPPPPEASNFAQPEAQPPVLVEANNVTAVQPQQPSVSDTAPCEELPRDAALLHTHVDEPATICKAAPGIKVFLPPPGLAAQKPAEVCARPHPPAPLPDRPPPIERQSTEDGGNKVGRIFELFGWAKPSESSGAHFGQEDRWAQSSSSRMHPGSARGRAEVPHDRSSFISSQDFDLNYDPPAAPNDFLRGSQRNDEDVSQWLASILAGTDEVNASPTLYDPHQPSLPASSMQWDSSYLSCFGSNTLPPTAGIEHYNTQRRPAKRPPDHRRQLESPAGMDLLRSVIPNATISFSPNMVSYRRPLRSHMHDERES